MAEHSNSLELPHNGKLWLPDKQTSDVVFIFIHHYGGSGRSMRRHVCFANGLGFRAVTFDLGGAHNQGLYFPPIGRNLKWGLRSIWADRIEDILKVYANEEKVIFSLSNPSYSVLDVLYRTQAQNIKAAIFDGGPFFEATKCYWNLFTHAYPTPFIARLIQILWGMVYWNLLFYKKRAYRFLQSFQNSLPILSIRAEKDLLVPVDAIDSVFKNYPEKNITRVLLKDEEHILGLKNQPKFYKQNVINFLTKQGLM